MPPVTGAGGVRLRVRAAGPTDAPVVVLVHGWSQSLDAWDLQFESHLTERCRLVAYDLRGHGRSDAPAGAEHYVDGRSWADDLAAVIDATCGPEEPATVVGWSYGGFVVSDYLRHHGPGRLRSIGFVSASVNLDADQVPRYLSPAFPPLAERAASPDLAEAEAAIREFLTLCPSRPLDSERFEALVATNLLTRPDVRAALGARTVRSDGLLGALQLPVLVIQGSDDPVVLPATARYICRACPTARLVEYEGVGHLPMIEAADRLADDLARLAAP